MTEKWYNLDEAQRGKLVKIDINDRIIRDKNGGYVNFMVAPIIETEFTPKKYIHTP